MSQRVFKSGGWTPTAVADATNFTNLGFMALQGGSSTQMTAITEIMVIGLAGASAPTPLILAHDSLVGASLTALTTGESDAAKHSASAALAAPVNPFTQASTKPQRSSTLSLLTCGLNAFGGIFKETFYQESDFIWMLGNTASLGEISLSCFTGGSPGLCESQSQGPPRAVSCGSTAGTRRQRVDLSTVMIFSLWWNFGDTTPNTANGFDGC